MSRPNRNEFTPDHPPRLTKDLVKKISEASKNVSDRTHDAPIAPLDWIAARAGVKKLTIQRWMKTANGVARSGAKGPKAQRWVKFRDAVDGLCAGCADRVAGKIGDLALGGGTDKTKLDALTLVQKRLDRQELMMDAADLEIEADTSVAQISQELLDALTDDECEALDRLQGVLADTASAIENLLVAAAGRVD